jgi:hypothetical protein
MQHNLDSQKQQKCSTNFNMRRYINQYRAFCLFVDQGQITCMYDLGFCYCTLRLGVGFVCIKQGGFLNFSVDGVTGGQQSLTCFLPVANPVHTARLYNASCFVPVTYRVNHSPFTSFLYVHRSTCSPALFLQKT